MICQALFNYYVIIIRFKIRSQRDPTLYWKVGSDGVISLSRDDAPTPFVIELRVPLDSPNPPSWSARMTSSSRPRVSQAMAKMSRPMITAGLSLANTRMCLNSVTLSIASSTWTLPIEMSTASLVIWFSKMIKISARRGSWSEKILLVSKCWVGAAISELYHDDKGYSRSHFSPPFFRLLIFRYGEILLEDWIFLSFRWLWIITLIWWRPRRNLGAGCHGLFFSSGLVTLHRWHMEPKE